MSVNISNRIVMGQEAGLLELTRGFNRGFEDYRYGLQFTPEEMAWYLQQSGIEVDDCAVLLVAESGAWRGGGVALLAVEGLRAWCGGLAVAPAYRGKDLGRRLMLAVHDQARSRGATSMVLEALVWNQPARLLYERLGYRARRELLVWERPCYQGALPVPIELLQPTDPLTIIGQMHGWHDEPPSWDRRAPSLSRLAQGMQGYTIPAKDGNPIAYVLCQEGIDPKTKRPYVRIRDVAVDPHADVLLAGRALLQAFQLKYLESDLLVINEPVDSRLNRVFAALQFHVVDRQYELTLALHDTEPGGAQDG